mmetsp:Transcript_15509/g.28454  ORF Transcript_15509/g.28454 Transcript_15509/m.28454 type:complete len:286 (-) Transcript_15509:115-972(-)
MATPYEFQKQLREREKLERNAANEAKDNLERPWFTGRGFDPRIMVKRATMRFTPRSAKPLDSPKPRTVRREPQGYVGSSYSNTGYGGFPDSYTVDRGYDNNTNNYGGYFDDSKSTSRYNYGGYFDNQSTAPRDSGYGYSDSTYGGGGGGSVYSRGDSYSNYGDGYRTTRTPFSTFPEQRGRPAPPPEMPALLKGLDDLPPTERQRGSVLFPAVRSQLRAISFIPRASLRFVTKNKAAKTKPEGKGGFFRRFRKRPEENKRRSYDGYVPSSGRYLSPDDTYRRRQY